MLIHITPRFFACPVSGPEPKLVKLEIPQFNYVGHEGSEIDTRRPYPNKHYQVGCRKIGKKAVGGFLFDVQHPPEHFEMIAHWRIGSGETLVHKIDYFLNDREHDAASDLMLLWMGFSEDGKDFEPRFIKEYENATPAEAMPRMSAKSEKGRKGLFEDRKEGILIVVREERFIMPSIESERLTLGFSDTFRVPNIEQAIKVKGV